MNKIFRVVWNQATQSWVAVSELTKAHKKQSSSNSLKAVVGTAAVLLSINTAQAAVAIGETTANNTFTQSSAQATGNNAVAIGQNSKATKDDTIALGTNSKSTNTYTVALGRNTEAAGQRSMAFGNEAKATANDTIAFGSSSEAKKNNDIIIGKEAKSRDEGGGHSVAVGYNATAGSTKTGAATDVTSTGKNTAAGGVAIGVSSYTGLNRNNAAINSSVAIGAGAGAGFRAINADGIPTGNGTDPDDNATVLAKAFGNTSTEAGNKDAANRFDYKGVDINEGTAVGRNTRAIGDQAVALGAQSIAGQGAIAIGGNDITQFANARYFMSNRDNFGVADVSDHDQSGTLASKNISQKYQELVGAALNTAYQATYAQNGSTVIGMQAHSTTPLGVAIGTNALVRKGAYGATAIGSGSAIQANAEAAVAIGMGSWVNGKFGVAAGTASRAEQSAVAAGYKANADKSAVAIGDSSNATTSSVAVGQLAQATKEADIAVGQGAKASGNQGAIAMGLGTNAQGDSSIMIGGADIKSASAQTIKYQEATGGITSRDVTETINGTPVTRHYSFSETKEVSGTIAKAYKELTGLDMETDSINFADAKNKNGHASTSLGVHALSKGDLGTAIGASSRADAIGSVALGVGAHATKQNAVAIGTGSTTDLVGTRQLSVNYDSDGNIVSDNSKDIAYTFKWAGGTNTAEGDVVSFGSSGAERQLKNVAAGRVAEDSTDAINGSQLNSITKKIAAGFNTSGNEVAGSSGVFTSKKANADSAKKDYETAIRSDDKVQLQVGNNLKLDRDETVSEVDVPDDFDKTKTVKKKIRKADFAYSLNPVLTNLTSAEFKGTDAEPTTKLTNAGVTITPVTAGKSPVSLTENGLNNGGNPITNVAGNLDGAKANTTAPTTKADKPSNVDGIKNNAATVGDVLNAGWNLQEKGTAKDFVTAYDTVNFVDGDGTTVSVENTDGKTSKIKYSANLGDGLKKDDATNKITVNAADKSLTVGTDGVKVNTGNINTAAVPTVDAGDENKIATVGNVVDAIKAAAWKATSAATTNGENSGKKEQEVKAGDTVTFEADKNIKITQADGKFTFATKENVTFNTVQVGGDQGPKLSKSDAGDLKVSGPNSTDPVKVTNVKDGDISADSKDAINGSQFHKLANNTIQLKGQTGDKAVTETNKQALNKENGIAFTVKSSDGTLLEVTAADDTITLTPKTATLTTGADGVPTADTTNGKLVTADQLVNTLTEMGWKATADKDGSGTVSGAATELIKAGNTVTFKAGDNLAVKQDGKNFIYSLQKELTGLTSAEFKNQAGDKTVINSDGMKITPKDAPANPVSLTKDGLDNGGKTVKNVTSGLMNYAEGTPKAGLVDLSKPASGNPTVPDTTAATVGDLRNMGWVVSSDKTTDGNGAYSEQVKNADEVKFVGKNAAKVSGKTENGVRTITVDVEVPDVKTAELVSSKDGSVIAPSTNPELQKALKTAKDELAAAATPEQKEAAEKKVKDAETELNKALDDKGVATAKNVADMINASGFTLKTSNVDGGEKVSGDDEVINPGKAVEMVAGKNLTVKQEANGKVTYSTKDEVEFNTVKVGGDANTYVDDKGNPVTKKEDGSFEDAEGNKVAKDKVSPVAPVTLKTEKASPANNNAEGNHPTTALNVSSDGKPTQITGVGSTLNVKPVGTNPNGTPTADADKPNLVDLVGTKDAPVNKNAAATVGDLQNMGWVVSTKDGNGYTDVVKNANQVDFKGDGLATVTGETKDGIRTITVNVDAQKTVEAAQNPVVYTDSEGNKVTKLGDNFYPVEEAKDAVKIGDNYYPAGTVLKDGKPVDSEGNEATALVPTDKKTVKASMNNGDNEAAPTVLSNVGSNLPTVDDVKKKAFNPNDSENPLANKSNKAAPITALEAAELLDPTSDKFAGNNAATVSDVLNAGWNLQNNGEARDFVKPYDTVNFINGKGTVAVVETADDATSSTVKFDVDAGEITADTTKPGAVKGPNTTGKTPAELAKNLADAQKAVDDLAKDPLATEDAKQKAQDALKAAQDDSALLNKVATAQNVADMINQSGWNATSAATTGGEVSGTTKELINPSETVTFEAGKNISITQAENKFTFATKDNVEFNTVKVGGDANTYVDDKGNPVTKKEDGSFEDAEGNKVAKDKVSPVAPVTLKTEKASPANNNAEGNHPTTALNVSSDGKPTQLTGVGSVLNTTAVPTTPEGTLNGKAPTEAAKQPKLVNLTNEDGSPLDDAILNSAATVRDIANMGWVVSTKDSNGYKDVVKNANQVDFVGKNGITVTGETKDGIRTITVETAQSPVVYTDKEGNKLVKAGDNFYPADSVVFGDKAYPADSVVIDGNVYPAGTTADDVKAGTATPATALANGKKPADVIASMNNGDDKSANAPMQLGNVAQGAETIAPVDADGNKLVKANDGKYYPEGKVKADGSLEDGTTDADVKQPLKLANDGKWYPADQISAKGVPTDTAKAVTPPAKMDPAAGLVDFANSNPNNAATVGDLQNMGWIVGAPANGYTDQVRNANKVNFVGKGIATVTGETDAEGVRTITVNVANGLVDVAKNAGTATGAVTGPKKAAEDALKAAQEELANATDDAAKKAAQDKIDAAQNALNNAGNLVATAQNVADMINQSGWNATSAATTGGEVSGTTKELINPSETVTFEAGKNISITQAENKFTFATKDDVEFNTVKIANPNGATYTDKNNNPLVKADDDKFYPADQVENGKVKDPATATPVEADKVTTKAAPSVEFKAENATPATNNTGKDKDGKTVEPTTALNISSDDGKPTQLKGVGSVLNTADVNTSTGDQRDTDGNITPAQAGTDKLVDLGTNPKEGDKPLSEETLNSAATVRDLANMGWVVSAKDNNYTNTVKNANKVEFKGKNGISVTGKDVTQQDGTVTREITVAIAEGSVTDKVTITTKDGKEIPAIKIGDNYYSVDKDGKPVGYEVDANGKPTANNKPLDVTGAEIKNNGAGFVTGNTVATAIQESGWNVGLANTADADKAFNDADKALSATKLEKVNPNDNVRFADGKGTKAAVATVERVDEFGKKVTDTYVKFDVDAGKVEAAKDAAGNNTGAVTGPVTTVLNDALTKAQEAKKALKPDATQAEKDAAQAAVDAANLAITNAGNQVATAQNVAEAINNSGWRTNSTTATGGAKDTLINPGKAVNFEAGKNMEVAQTVDKDGNVAYTYKTKDDVQFNSVQFGGDTGPKITNNGGNINVSGPDGKAPTKITGVAAGDISPESSDAVNGAQIYALSRGNVPNVKNITVDGKEYKNVIVDENGTPILKTYNVKGQKEIITNSVVEAIYNMNEQGIKFFHSNDGVERLKVEDKNSFDSSASGKFATAIGSKSSAEGTNAVAIGFNSVVTGNDSISIGTGNRVTGNNSGAFGDPSIINGNSSYSVGNNNTVATNDTFVLGNEVKHTVENSVILGTKSTATAGDGSATATLNNIKQDGTKGTSTTAGSKGTVKQAIVGNMVYGGFEGATADGVVSVGAAGNERRIQNVAAGEISATSTDAINGSQLYSVAQGVGNRLGDLNNKINRNNKNLRAGIAGANAAAGLPQVYIPGKSMVAASAGTYKGQSALAVGYSRASDNGKLILKLQGNANTRGDVGGSVGVGYQW